MERGGREGAWETEQGEGAGQGCRRWERATARPKWLNGDERDSKAEPQASRGDSRSRNARESEGLWMWLCPSRSLQHPPVQHSPVLGCARLLRLPGARWQR